ncbi:putative membrane protein [Candidatus Electrothrix marina]|uniref:Putative membrane protein n=1 Tax=Candidatus Electrothrix marina TaxID=1859130 RepID=A0A444JBD6_9BACT|nr:putative membrane protein [Candidatus Electrothrix marina]
MLQNSRVGCGPRTGLMSCDKERILKGKTEHGGRPGTGVSIVEWLKLVVETIGALIIALGVIVAVSTFIRAWVVQRHADFTKVRLALARYLALALEFQLGADILSTAVAPSWDQIGKLGAIAVIRTVLNFFLMREMREEKLEEHEG